MRSLKVGIIGAGEIVKSRHLPGLRKLEGVEIVAVANSTYSSALAFCAQHVPQANAIERWQDLAALPELDIVWIGAGPFLHKDATVAALAAGKHVFCQARMAMNLVEAEEMFAAAEARPELVTMLCPPPHGMEGDAVMRDILREDLIGDIRAIRLQSFSDAFLSPTKPPHWRQRREISGLNVLTLGIYTEVLQRWFGDFTVKAAAGQIFVPERDGYRIHIPDALQVLADFANGAAGMLEFSGVHSGKGVENLEVVGTTGILRYDLGAKKIFLQRPGETEWAHIPIPEEKAVPWRVEADFINAVRDPLSPRPHPSFGDGLRYMRVTQQVADLL